MEIGGFPFFRHKYSPTVDVAPNSGLFPLVNHRHEIDENGFRGHPQSKEVNSVPSVLRLYFLFPGKCVLVTGLFIPRSLRLKAPCHGYSCREAASSHAVLLTQGIVA